MKGRLVLEIRRPLVIVGLLVLLAMLVVSFISLRSFSSNVGEQTAATITAYIQRSRIVERQLQVVDKRTRFNEFQLRRLQVQVSKLARPSNASRLTSRVDGMEQDVRQLEADQVELEDALLNNPAKALQLPLLARDIESDRRANEAALLAIRQEMDRQNGLMQWVLGTFALSVLGLLVTVLIPVFRGSKETK
jgi:hypothetical protein